MPVRQTRKTKREAETAREEATELGQRLAARQKRTAELEARAEEAARAAEGHRSELAGALAAAKARESEARHKAEAAEKRMSQVSRLLLVVTCRYQPPVVCLLALVGTTSSPIRCSGMRFHPTMLPGRLPSARRSPQSGWHTSKLSYAKLRPRRQLQGVLLRCADQARS